MLKNGLLNLQSAQYYAHHREGCCSSNIPQYYAHHQELKTYRWLQQMAHVARATSLNIMPIIRSSRLIQVITANGTCYSNNVPQYYAHHQELETYTGDYSKWHMLLEQRPSTRTHSPQPHSRPHDQLLTKCHVPHTVITCIVSSSWWWV